MNILSWRRYMFEQARIRRGNSCRVYMSSHGCYKKRGHRGIHKCECGVKLLGQKFGDDYYENRT